MGVKGHFFHFMDSLCKYTPMKSIICNHCANEQQTSKIGSASLQGENEAERSESTCKMSRGWILLSLLIEQRCERLAGELVTKWRARVQYIEGTIH